MPRFSLVVCTIGRPDDLRNLFHSLRGQVCQDFEVILVDQSKDAAIRTLLAEDPAPFPLRYFQSRPGLSLGRNLGLQHACGDVIAFPDDDCAYEPGTLQQVDLHLRDGAMPAGITGRSIDSLGRISGPRSPDAPCQINEANIWRCGISYTIFLRRNVVEKTGGFDERLGVGAGTPFGSGEETDYLLRALREGFTLQYFPDITIQHPGPDALSLKTRLEKDYRYATGLGFVVRKNRLGLRYFLPHLIKPLLGALYYLARFDIENARVRLCRFRGRWKGYFQHQSALLPAERDSAGTPRTG